MSNRYTLLAAAVLPTLISAPTQAEELTGTAISINGSQPIKIDLDKAGGGTLSIGDQHYVLKLDAPVMPKAESLKSPAHPKEESSKSLATSKTESSTSSGSPEAAEYMAKVGALIKRHWHKSLNMPEKHVVVRFYIKSDGSIDDLKLDPSSDQKLDEFTVRAFDAVKQAVPFPSPPTSVLKEGRVEIRFSFDINHKSQTFGFGRGFFYSH